MNGPKEMRQRADLSDYLAAERTLLPWIRRKYITFGMVDAGSTVSLFLSEFRGMNGMLPNAAMLAAEISSKEKL
jgi:uncharacterized membrane protein YidH (DUF202 family)